jgi:hypothetical protein
LQHAIPAVAVGIMKISFSIRGPFPVEHGGGILPLEICAHGLFEGPAKHHCGPSVLLLPAVEVAMLVAARAGQVLADLGIAVGHEATSDPRGSLSAKTDSSSHRPAGAKPSKLRTAMPCTVTSLTFTIPQRSISALSSISFFASSSAS